MNHGSLTSIDTVALGLLAAGADWPPPLDTAERNRGARAIKAQLRGVRAGFSDQEPGGASQAGPPNDEQPTPEKLRAIPEYMNQMFLPHDEWQEAFKGRKGTAGRFSLNASRTWLPR